MSKGTYEVNENGPQAAPKSRDASYKSCLCALLIFFALCIIIIALASIKWSKDATKEEPQKGDSGHSGLHGEHEKTTHSTTRATLPPENTSKATMSTTQTPTTTTATRTTITSKSTTQDDYYDYYDISSTTEDMSTTRATLPPRNTSKTTTSTTPTTTTAILTTTTTTTSTSTTQDDYYDYYHNSGDISSTTEDMDKNSEHSGLHGKDEDATQSTTRTTLPPTNISRTTVVTTPTTTTTTTTSKSTTQDYYDYYSLGDISSTTEDMNETSEQSGLHGEHDDTTQSTTRATPPPTNISRTTTFTTPTTTATTTTSKSTTQAYYDYYNLGDISSTTEYMEEGSGYLGHTTETTTERMPSTKEITTSQLVTSTTESTTIINFTDEENRKNVSVMSPTTLSETTTEAYYSDLEESTTEMSSESTSIYESEFDTTTVSFLENIDQKKDVSTNAETTDTPTTTTIITTTTDSTKIPFIGVDENTTKTPTTLDLITESVTRSTPKTFSYGIITDDFYGGNDYGEESEIITTPMSVETSSESTKDYIKTTSSTNTPSTNRHLDDTRDTLSKKTSTTTTQSPLLLNTTQHPPVCSTVACKSEASRILSLMDHSADPCEDFYEFACGGMQVDNDDSDTWRRILEQLYLINNTAPSYLLTFRNFYDSCVNHEYVFDYKQRIEGVLTLVKDVGQIYDVAPTDEVDITELFAKLIIRRALPVMDVDIDLTKGQDSTFILKLTSPKLTSILKESGRWSALTEAQMRCLDEQRNELQKQNLNLTKIYESYLACQKDHSIYLDSIQTVVRALGFYSHVNNTFNETQLIQNLRTTIEWEILENLNALPPPGAMRKEYIFKNFTVYRISDLQFNYPYLEWNKLFKIITGYPNLDTNTYVQVYFPSYLSTLFETLRAAPKWKINNALVAMYAHNLYENLVIPQAKHTREDYCIKLSSNLFNDISSNLYLKTWHADEIKNSQKILTGVFNLLKFKLKSVFQNPKKVGDDWWLDDDSQIRVLTKLNKMRLTFNKLEDTYNSQSYLNAKYSGDVMDPGNFQNNVIKMFQKHSMKRYNLQGKPCSSKEMWSYFLNAFDISPTSFYSDNLILAPLGMVKQPVKESLGYITMARIGLSLAREIGRHFDPVGIQYGMTLSSASKPSYDALVNIMKDDPLFNGVRSIGHQSVTFEADTELSVNERIADNTGMRLVTDNFDALDDDQRVLPWISMAYVNEKVFFIAAAQEYCKKTEVPEYMRQLFETEILPPSLRVKNIISNSERFSELFECREGSAMNHNPFKRQFPHIPKEIDYNYDHYNDN